MQNSESPPAAHIGVDINVGDAALLDEDIDLLDYVDCCSENVHLVVDLDSSISVNSTNNKVHSNITENGHTMLDETVHESPAIICMDTHSTTVSDTHNNNEMKGNTSVCSV